MGAEVLITGAIFGLQFIKALSSIVAIPKECGLLPSVVQI
jgi:hypothetical protein